MTIFIGGSINFKTLDNSIIKRLENIIEQKCHVAIGDADGADKAIQEFFLSRKYNDVEIFCAGNLCRNNLNNWPTHNVEVSTKITGRKFYMIKDLAMAKVCDYGFMLWNGKSPGTMNNILNIIEGNKKVLVFFSPTTEFFTIFDIKSLNDLMKLCKSEHIEEIDRKIHLHKRIKEIKEPIPEQLQLII